MWLLAVVDGDPPDVRMVRHEGLTAVVESADDGPAAGSDLILRQAEVVAALLGSCRAVVPARAGSRVDGEQAVRRLLAERADEFRGALDRVAGNVELAVRCEPEPARRPVAVADGRGYLRARVREWHWVDATAERLAALQGTPGVRDVRLLAHRPGAVKASLLVEREMVDEVRDAVLRSGPHLEGVLNCTGPYPPYSFVDPPSEVAA